MQVLSARQTLYSNSYITFDWPLVSHFPAIYQSKYQLQPANGRCTQVTFSVNKFTFVFSVPSTACYMWFNYFILGFHFILLYFWVWKCKIMSLKQRKIKFKPQNWTTMKSLKQICESSSVNQWGHRHSRLSASSSTPNYDDLYGNLSLLRWQQLKFTLMVNVFMRYVNFDVCLCAF